MLRLTEQGYGIKQSMVWLLRIALLSAALVFPTLTIVQNIDDRLVDTRANFAPREASGTFVFLAIDKESLDHVGIWPWPRSVHAAIVDSLVAAEVTDIFLDIDFSTPSTTAEDQTLAAALEHAGGGVILPVFEQQQRVMHGEASAITQPIDLLARNAWLAAANLTLDSSGQFRGFSGYMQFGDERLPSASLVLAGMQDPGLPNITVDYSIRPQTVITISVADLLRGTVDPTLLKGRSIVVGAYATELKDVFPVPVYGVLSGPMLHILAAETLLQDRVPSRLPIWPLSLAVAITILALASVFRVLPFRVAAMVAVLLSVSVEAGAFLLQKEWSLVLPSATLQILLAGGLAIILLQKMDLSAWLLEVASAERRNARRILRRVIQDSTDAVIIVDRDRRVLDQSRSVATLLGTDNHLRRGEDFRRAAPPELVALLERQMSVFEEDCGRLLTVQENLTIIKNGKPLHLDVSLTISRLDDPSAFVSSVACITIRDVTARKIYEAKLRRLAQFDDLTGALNRTEFVRRLAKATEQPGVIAVCAVDLHHFSTVNATFGRKVGDGLLQAAARRLKASARKTSRSPDRAFVGRLGGDVFCLAIDLGDERSLGTLPGDLVTLFEKSLACGGTRVRLDVRIGACLSTDARGGPAGWIAAAEFALDQAKKTGGSGWHVYEPVAASQQARRMRLEQEMRSALGDGQFFLLYQPQVDLRSRRICGAEALMRWRHPELGLVSPGEFIEVAESNGFIRELGRWALLEACTTAAKWPVHMPVAVNASAVQFARGDFVADVRAALHTSGLEPERLHVEVTETAFLFDPKRLLKDLEDLRALGVRTALDDFGTGYSSLGYIARFPFDKIKIDQSFVRGIAGNVAAQAIVGAVQTLSNSLGMVTVCEGIEEQADGRMVMELGCQQGQGYLFGRPQEGETVRTMAEDLFQASA